MKPQNDNRTQYIVRRKWLSAVSLVTFVVILVLLTLLFTKVLSPYLKSADKLREFLETYGWKGRFILLGL